MPKKPLCIISGLIIIALFFTGIRFLNNPSFSSCEEKEEACDNNNSLFLDKKTKIDPEYPQLSFIQKNSLTGIVSSQIFSSDEMAVLGSLIAEELPEEKRQITEYVVQEGDTLISIAVNFDISLNTLLWANDLNKNSIIKPDQKLIILPTSGTIHHVKDGDTLSGIAQAHKAKVSEIIAFNELLESGDIFIGDILIVPNGTQPTPSYSSLSEQGQIPLASSYFILPVSSPYKITQGLHWYNAIDFANIVTGGNSCGKPVFAAAGGVIQKIGYGYNQGAGNYIRIFHSNGLITHYGHLQKIFVTPGQNISQGDLIGLIGNNGYTVGSSGCHLHFAVYSSTGNPPRNPFAR